MTGAADKPVLTLPDGHFPDDSRRLRTIIIWAIRAMAPTSLARSPDRVRFPNVSTFFMGAPPAPPNGVKLSSDMAEIKEIHSTRRHGEHGGHGEIHGYRVGPSLYFRRGRRVRGAAVLNCLLADELYDIGLRPRSPTGFVGSFFSPATPAKKSADDLRSASFAPLFPPTTPSAPDGAVARGPQILGLADFTPPHCRGLFTTDKSLSSDGIYQLFTFIRDASIVGDAPASYAGEYGSNP